MISMLLNLCRYSSLPDPYCQTELIGDKLMLHKNNIQQDMITKSLLAVTCQ